MSQDYNNEFEPASNYNQRALKPNQFKLTERKQYLESPMKAQNPMHPEQMSNNSQFTTQIGFKRTANQSKNSKSGDRRMIYFETEPIRQ